MFSLLRPVLVLFAALTLVTGILYPLLVSGIGRAVFAEQIDGSPGGTGRQSRGVKAHAQSFQEPKYFWGRLSATAPMPNNGAASGASNFGPLNPALVDAVKARIDALKGRRSGQSIADSGRSGDGVGQRPGSGYHTGGRPVPGRAGGPRTAPRCRQAAPARSCSRTAASMGDFRRSASQCLAAQFGLGWAP